MKSPIPRRGGLPGKEIIHAPQQLCLKSVEERDLVGFNDKSWGFAVSAVFRTVNAGTTELIRVV